jgi:hypothetical protein
MLSVQNVVLLGTYGRRRINVKLIIKMYSTNKLLMKLSIQFFRLHDVNVEPMITRQRDILFVLLIRQYKLIKRKLATENVDAEVLLTQEPIINIVD